MTHRHGDDPDDLMAWRKAQGTMPHVADCDCHGCQDRLSKTAVEEDQ